MGFLQCFPASGNSVSVNIEHGGGMDAWITVTLAMLSTQG